MTEEQERIVNSLREWVRALRGFLSASAAETLLEAARIMEQLTGEQNNG